MYGFECTLHSSTTHTTTILNYNKLGSPLGNPDQQAGAQLLHAAQPHPIHLPQVRINPQKCWNTESQQIKGQKPSIFKAQPVFCICSKNIERVKCNEALDKAALAARQFLNSHAPFRSWALAESLPKSHRRRSMNKVLSVAWWQMKPSRALHTNPGQPPAGQFSGMKYLLLFPVRADSHRSAPQGRCLRSCSAGQPAAARRGRPQAAGAPRSAGSGSSEPPARPFPSSPQRRAPGTWEHRPRGDGRPCPPRAEPPGHGQPLSTRAAASHLSPRKLPAQRPAACRPVGPAGRLSRRLRLSLGPCPAATTP